MRRSQILRIVLTLTMIATFVTCTTLVFARGRNGGGRQRAGGRPSSAGDVIGHARSGHSGAVSNRSGSGIHGKNLSSKANGFVPQAHNYSRPASNFSSQAGHGKPGLASDKRHQNLRQKSSGPLQGNFSQRSGLYQQHANPWAQQTRNYPRPFSSTWYAQHPNAWHHSPPRAGAAIVASTAAVAAWVSGYYTPANSGGSSTTVVYQEAPAEEVASERVSNSVVANVTEPNPTAAEAWLPLGIYSVSNAENVPTTRMLQLAINHHGDLRGVFYDSLTNTSQNIVGQLDRETQVVQWSLESNKNLTFEAPLEQLTQPTGHVQVNLPTGSELWNLAQVDLSEK